MHTILHEMLARNYFFAKFAESLEVVNLNSAKALVNN